MKNITTEETLKQEALVFAKQGKTPVYIAKNGKLTAIFAIADPIKPDAAAAIKMLKDTRTG